MITRSYIDGEIIWVLRLCLNQLVLNYGESYMTETNNYWKTEVSKLVRGYMQTTNGMPGNPVNIAGVNKTVRE
jgi:hypothetical protein